MERDRVKVHERHRMRMKALCLAIALGISLFIYPLLSRAAVNDRAVQENFPAVLSPERVPADPDDEISTQIRGIGRILENQKGHSIAVRQRIAQNLYKVKTNQMTAESFFRELARMEMPPGMEPRHMLNLVKKDIFDSYGTDGLSLFFGELHTEGGSQVETTLLEWRRQTVFDAVDEVMVIMKERYKNRPAGERFTAFLAEVGSWTTESLKQMRFAGDIDFSFVCGDIAIAMEMKALYEEIILRKTDMRAEDLDVPCTAHGMASPEVYMGRHGQVSGEGFMLMHKKGLLLLDFEQGIRTDTWVKAEEALKQVVLEAQAARIPLINVMDVKWPTEPGITLEMIRHFEHDIIAKNIYTDIDAFLKAAKYLERSVEARYGKDFEPADPLSRFAKELMKMKKGSTPSDIAKFIMENFQRVTGKAFPDVLLGDAVLQGQSRVQIHDRDQAIRHFWSLCRNQMWTNAVEGLNQGVQRIKTLISAAADEASARMAYDELYKLREMMEVEMRILSDPEYGVKTFPPEFVNLMDAFRLTAKEFHQKIGKNKWGVKILDVESQQVFRFVDDLLRADTPSGAKMAVAALLHSPHFINNFLDVLDDRLIAGLRGQDVEMKPYFGESTELFWRQKMEGFLGISPRAEARFQAHLKKGQEIVKAFDSEMTSLLAGKLTARVQQANRIFGESVQSSRFGGNVMTGLVAFNLSQEIPAYLEKFYQAAMHEGDAMSWEAFDKWGELAREIIRRRVPLGSTAEYLAEGWYGLAAWDFCVTLVPPLGLLNVAASLSSSAFTWGLNFYWSRELILFQDRLYQSAVFYALAKEDRTRYEGGATLGWWHLYKVTYGGTEIEIEKYLADKAVKVQELMRAMQTPHSRRELPPDLIWDPLTGWTKADQVLRLNLAYADGWLTMIEEMKKNPHVGEKLLDHLRDLWFVRWEQVKLEFVRHLKTRLEERRAAELAVELRQLPLMVKELERLTRELQIEESMNKQIEAELGGASWEVYRFFLDWAAGRMRALYGEPSIERHIVETARVTRRYLDVYTFVLEARREGEEMFAMGIPVNNGLRFLTGPFFLQGGVSTDEKTYPQWRLLPPNTRGKDAKELLAIKRKYVPGSHLEEGDSFDGRTLQMILYHDVWRELWKHVQSQGIQGSSGLQSTAREWIVGSFVPAAAREQLDRLIGTQAAPDPVERHGHHTQQRRDLVQRFEEYYRYMAAETGIVSGDTEGPGAGLSKALFVVLIEASGYTATYGAGTWDISGSEERVMTVNRNEDVKKKLLEMKKTIDGDPCENAWPAQGLVEDDPGSPRFITAGSKITIIDGPYFSAEKLRDRPLKKSWRLLNKEGPHPRDLQIMCSSGRP